MNKTTHKGPPELRILLHFPYFTDNKNSMGLYVEELYLMLINNGFDVTVCCIASSEKFCKQINSGKTLGSGYARYVKLLFLYAAMFVNSIFRKPDVIINVSQEFVYPFFLRRSVNVIHDAIQILCPRSRFINVYMKFMLLLIKRSRTNICVSNATASDFSKFGIKSTVIYNHFNDNLFANRHISPSVFLYDAIWCGTGAPHKNIGLFLQLAAARPKRKFALVIPHNEGLCLAFLNNVSVFSSLSIKEYIGVICKSKMLISTSTIEGFGRPPMEALMLGVPAIISDIPIYREIFGDFARFHDLTLPGIAKEFDRLAGEREAGGFKMGETSKLNSVRQPISDFLPVIKAAMMDE